jgi:chromate reductase, NAD(P)H dehydrogenase (quinone)
MPYAREDDMVTQKDVVVLVGSLREASISGKVARTLQALSPTGIGLEIVKIGHLPFYNQDLETGTPPSSWTEFRDRIRACDAVLFVTPEYNRSIPAVLKNAIDVGSRPYGRSVWSAKPGAIVSSSPGLLGGSAAALHLRQILTSVVVLTLPHPEVYLSGADKMFDESGALANEGTRGFLEGFLRAFGAWIARF